MAALPQQRLPPSTHPYATATRSTHHQAGASYSQPAAATTLTQHHTRSSSLAQTPKLPVTQAMSMSGVAAALPQQPQAQPQGVASTAMTRETHGGPNGNAEKGSTRAGKDKREGQGAKATQQQAKKEEPRKVRFSVGTKYAVQDVIGEGAYGVVASAIHRPTGQKVAIKKIAPFDHSNEFRFFAKGQVSENIISVVDLIKPSSLDSFKEVYLIQELMETDLYRVIKTQTLSDDHVQYFIYQTLRALKALHSADVIHRDLKPSNLLLNANCDLKVCDFGLARSVTTAEPNGGETGFMTEYVATRWYRAPEIMLTFKQYTKAIDIWSVGCIAAEMLSGRPIFPGRDYHNQLSLILGVTGTPTLDEFYKINSRRSRDYLRALPFQKKRDFGELFPNASSAAVDFLAKTLTFDPTKRLTVEQCLEHPYVAAYHDPEDEPTAPPLPPAFFDFDLQKEEISKDQLKVLLFEEVMAFQPLV
ncbi:hypothetical protein JCM16303_007223 [Sporobolomyces ruberrimus]